MNTASEQPASVGTAHRNRISPIWVIAGLIVCTLAVYLRVVGFEFVDIDDWVYVTSNTHVLKGLTGENFQWALTARYAGNWHPVTTLSHMVDCQLYGTNAGGHHFTNLFLHLTNTALLFLILRKLTGAMWRSAIVAALFALHPLHIESVAWISERKDVLSAFFFFAALCSYVNYASDRQHNRSGIKSYAATLVLFTLGLLSKPMVVTFPFVLLLVDYWPLKRFTRISKNDLTRVLVEKIPFLLLSIGSSVVTFFAQKSGGAVVALQHFPLPARLANSLVAYGRYLLKTIWPEPLSVFYPYEQWPAWQIIASTIAFFGLSILAVFSLRRRPYVFFGWFWFVGMLVPVIGLVQVGTQSMADRYTYLPLVGVFIAIVWLVAEFRTFGRAQAVILSALAGIVLGACAFKTSSYLTVWRNSELLFAHSASVTRGNAQAHYSLGVLLEKKNDIAAAFNHYTESIKAAPDFVDPRCARGNLLRKQKHFAEAAADYEVALRSAPDSAAAHYGYGNLLLDQRNFGSAKLHFEQALRFNPDFAGARYQLATILASENDPAGAIEHWESALKINPDWLEALNNLAWLLATHPDANIRNGSRALELAKKAVVLTKNGDAGTLDTLAAAYAELNRFPEALDTAKHALQIAKEKRQQSLESEIATHVESYEQGKPIRQ